MHITKSVIENFEVDGYSMAQVTDILGIEVIAFRPNYTLETLTKLYNTNKNDELKKIIDEVTNTAWNPKTAVVTFKV